MSDISDITWSEWLEFNQDVVEGIPNTPGVFRMHAAMKMFYIGGTPNLKEKLAELKKNSCTCDATRFCYFETKEYEKIQEALINDFRKRHDDQLPKCM